MIIERHDSRSLRAGLVNAAVLALGRPLLGRLSGDLTQEMLDKMAKFDRAAVRVRPPRGTRVEPVEIDGLRAEWVHGAGVTGDRGAVLYLHGGGWLFGGLNSHRSLISRLSTACGLPALALDYRMVPTVSFAQETEDCVTAYAWLLERGFGPGQIAVIGDSAGGHLALSTALRAKARGLPAPAALVGLSGVYDMASTAREAHANARRDRAGLLGALSWMMTAVLGGADPADPEVSPVRADLEGLSPTLLTVGSEEVVYSDSERLAGLLAAAGVPCTLQVWRGQPHVFQAFAPIIPEAQRSITAVGEFVRAAMA